MHRDQLLDQEIVPINEQHKRELANHEISICYAVANTVGFRAN